MRRLLSAVFLIAWLRGPAVAGPVDAGSASAPDHDPNAAPVANLTSEPPGTDPKTTGPWLDLSPSRVLDPGPALDRRPAHRIAAATTLAGFYLGFSTWTYFAWYRNHKPLSAFKWGGDGNWKLWSDKEGWFGSRRYAGGADKLGHAWATYGLARGGTELLTQWGGFSRVPATLVSAGLSETLFFFVEVKDGLFYEFSFGDFTFNTIGAALSVAMSLSPRLDELFDFRVQYWPSKAYIDQLEGGNVNIAEDYTGETYLIALHLGGIHALRDRKYGTWTRFVDVAVGYGTDGYKPEPPPGGAPYAMRQHKYVGISLNAQGLFDWLFEKRSRPARKITHGLFEVFNAPFSFVPLDDHVTRPTGAVDPGGA